MKILIGKPSIFAILLFIVLLTACNGGRALVNESPTKPTVEPTHKPEIETEIVDLGYDTQLLLRDLPEDISVDAFIDLGLKGNLPPSNTKYDYVKSEIAIIKITKNGALVELETDVVELCFTVSYSGTGEAPFPFYWDTSIDPMVGNPLRKSSVVKEPNYTVCTPVIKTGAYAIVMH